uniref:Uncharacterized protein n=1 Tax=Tanacetum cinerariifolium TaxID=118510 RepID=A0A699HEW1_TANCI|nr:hypothetical protein [Tanacetum cinerariifolium]
MHRETVGDTSLTRSYIPKDLGSLAYSEETEGPYHTDLPTPEEIHQFLQFQRVDPNHTIKNKNVILSPNQVLTKELRQDLKRWNELIYGNMFRLEGHQDHLSACLAHILYCILAEQQYNLAYFFVNRIESARTTPKAHLPYVVSRHSKVVKYGEVVKRSEVVKRREVVKCACRDKKSLKFAGRTDSFPVIFSLEYDRMEPLYYRPLCLEIECAKFGIAIKVIIHLQWAKGLRMICVLFRNIFNAWLVQNRQEEVAHGDPQAAMLTEANAELRILELSSDVDYVKFREGVRNDSISSLRWHGIIGRFYCYAFSCYMRIKYQHRQMRFTNSVAIDNKHTNGFSLLARDNLAFLEKWLEKIESARATPKAHLPYGMFLTRLSRHVMEHYRHLDNGIYDVIEQVMHPLALRQACRPQSDHGKARHSVSSTSAHHNRGSSSR